MNCGPLVFPSDRSANLAQRCFYLPMIKDWPIGFRAFRCPVDIAPSAVGLLINIFGLLFLSQSIVFRPDLVPWKSEQFKVSVMICCVFLNSCHETFLAVWPDVGVKCGPSLSKRFPKSSQCRLFLKSDFQNSPKVAKYFWATFVATSFTKTNRK